MKEVDWSNFDETFLFPKHSRHLLPPAASRCNTPHSIHNYPLLHAHLHRCATSSFRPYCPIIHCHAAQSLIAYVLRSNSPSMPFILAPPRCPASLQLLSSLTPTSPVARMCHCNVVESFIIKFCNTIGNSKDVLKRMNLMLILISVSSTISWRNFFPYPLWLRPINNQLNNSSTCMFDCAFGFSCPISSWILPNDLIIWEKPRNVHFCSGFHLEPINHYC